MSSKDFLGACDHGLRLRISVCATDSLFRSVEGVGTILAIDFGLRGLGKNCRTLAQLSESIFVWKWAGFGIALLGGFLLLACSAETYLRNPAFLVKIGLLVLLGPIGQVVVQRKARNWNDPSGLPAAAKHAGSAELLLRVCLPGAAALIPTLG